MSKKPYQPQQMQAPENFNYKLHLAQQVEFLNQNIDLLKNNVYGLSQMQIILHYLSEGKTVQDAIEQSIKVIDAINEINMKRVEEKRKELEAKLQAENPLVEVQAEDTFGDIKDETEAVSAVQ